MVKKRSGTFQYFVGIAPLRLLSDVPASYVARFSPFLILNFMLIWLVEAHPSVVSASNANVTPFYFFAKD
jgi:hypothetical protein